MASGLAGKWMRVAQGATLYKVTDCDITNETEWNDTTNCESGPSAATGNNAEEMVPNINRGDLRMTVVYKPTDGVYASLQDGGSYVVTFYPDKTLTSAYETGTLSVKRFIFRGRLHDSFKADIEGSWNGGHAQSGL